MFAGFAWDFHIAHGGECMVESRAVLLVPALHGTAVARDATEAGRYPLHRLWIKREEIIAARMLDLGAAIGDTAMRR